MNEKSLRAQLPESEFNLVRVQWGFILAGAVSGVCLGLLLFPEKIEKGESLPIGLGLASAGCGAISAFIVGGVLWILAANRKWLVSILKLVTAIWMTSAIGAGVGWSLGKVPADALYPIVRDRPLGMTHGAMIGAAVGAIGFLVVWMAQLVQCSHRKDAG